MLDTATISLVWLVSATVCLVAELRAMRRRKTDLWAWCRIAGFGCVAAGSFPVILAFVNADWYFSCWTYRDWMERVGWIAVVLAYVLPKRVRVARKVVLLSLPLFPFLVYRLYAPFNKEFLVKYFGCGCHPGFNANSITLGLGVALWLVLTLALAKLLPDVDHDHYVGTAIVGSIMLFGLCSNTFYYCVWL